MNFTALVILLEIDNILAALYQKKIDLYEVKELFKYDPNTISDEFNRTADFLTARQGKFWIQRYFENLLFISITLSMFFVFTVIPIGVLVMYMIIEPKLLVEAS